METYVKKSCVVSVIFIVTHTDSQATIEIERNENRKNCEQNKKHDTEKQNNQEGHI